MKYPVSNSVLNGGGNGRQGGRPRLRSSNSCSRMLAEQSRESHSFCGLVRGDFLFNEKLEEGSVPR